MSYLAAPATKFLASRCACCSKPLADAASIESGVGPTCREKHGYGVSQGPADWAAALAALGTAVTAKDVAAWQEDARRAANALVYRVAVEQRGPSVAAYVAAIEALGFTTMAARITERLEPARRYGAAAAEGVDAMPALRITQDGGTLVLASPYAPTAVDALRKVPGRRWDGATSRNTFPAAALVALVWALRVGYPGQTVAMPDGTALVLEAIAEGEVAPVDAAPAVRVRVTQSPAGLVVVAPYSPKATEAFRAVKGRRYGGGGTNTFPALAKYEVRAAIERGYEGAVVEWPAGLFPARAATADMEATFGIDIDPAYA